MEIVLAFVEHGTQMYIYVSVDKQMAGCVVLHVREVGAKWHS